MALPTLVQSSTRLTQSIFYGRPSIGAVPSTRNINTTAPLTGGGPLSSDLTLALTTNPANQTPVGVTRQIISSTTALTVNGGSSANLTTDATLAIASFSGTSPGLVPTGSSDGTKFLSQTGWVTGGTVAGVAQAIAGTAISLSPSSGIGNVTFSVLPCNITQNGYAPATGGTDPTKFLCMTNPISWQVVPSVGTTVLLQATYPGTDQVGNIHVNSVIGADTAIVAGAATRDLNGAGNAPLYVKQAGLTAAAVIGAYSGGSGVGGNPAGLVFRTARGTESSPVAPQSSDELVSLNTQTYGGGVYSTPIEFLNVIAQGTGGANGTQFATTIYGMGISPGPSFLPSYIWLGPNQQIGVQTQSPHSGFEINQSYALTPTTINSSGTVTGSETASMYFIDATGGTRTFKLPDAGGRAGRLYTVVRVDNTSNLAQISTTSGQLINGGSVYHMIGGGDFATFVSDGSNWWTKARSTPYDRAVLSGDATVANTAVQTILVDFSTPSLTPLAGGTMALRAFGKLSTTGTPTLQFQVQNGSSEVLADSSALTMPNNASSIAWQIEAIGYQRTTLGTGRMLSGKLWLNATNGVGAAINTYNMLDVTLTSNSAGFTPFRLYAQWGTGSSSNTITCMGASLSQVQQSQNYP